MAFDVAGALKTIAPTLATMLGGPLAGTAVTALESALGLTPGAGTSGITQVLQGSVSPDQLTSIRSADQKHAEIMAQQQIDLVKINNDYQVAMAQADVADITSARTANVQGGTSKGLFWLSLALLTISVGAEITVLFHGYPAGVPDMVVGRVLGLLDAVSTVVVSYWFGSSHGSAMKNDLLKASKDGTDS